MKDHPDLDIPEHVNAVTIITKEAFDRPPNVDPNAVFGMLDTNSNNPLMLDNPLSMHEQGGTTLSTVKAFPVTSSGKIYYGLGRTQIDAIAQVLGLKVNFEDMCVANYFFGAEATPSNYLGSLVLGDLVVNPQTVSIAAHDFNSLLKGHLVGLKTMLEVGLPLAMVTAASGISANVMADAITEARQSAKPSAWMNGWLNCILTAGDIQQIAYEIDRLSVDLVPDEGRFGVATIADTTQAYIVDKYLSHTLDMARKDADALKDVIANLSRIAYIET